MVAQLLVRNHLVVVGDAFRVHILRKTKELKLKVANNMDLTVVATLNVVFQAFPHKIIKS